MGFIYKRGRLWWIAYGKGCARRESAETEDKATAADLLKLREGDIVRGVLPDIRLKDYRVRELLENLLADYVSNKYKSLPQVTMYCEQHLMPAFGDWKAKNLRKSDVKMWIAKKQVEGYENATINRWLSALNRAYALALEAEVIPIGLKVKQLKESNARKGFFEKEQFEAMRLHCPDWFRPAVDFAYMTGWRQSEIFSRQWKHVNVNERIIRLEPGETKNGEGRSFPLHDRLQSLLLAQQETTRALQQTQQRIIPWVFHKDGEPISKDTYREPFHRACVQGGCPGRLFHDFRRTAVRNMVLTGVPEIVAMKLSGHLTRSVFDRYSIVSQGDLRNASERMGETFQAGAPAKILSQGKG